MINKYKDQLTYLFWRVSVKMQVPGFMGPNGFVWFMGTIENNADPLQLGRVQVRCFGYHTDDSVELPTESLPWAIHVKPVTGGSDLSPTGMEVGATVFGFFADGAVAQYPVILGIIDNIVPRVGADPNATAQQVLTNDAGGESAIPNSNIDVSEDSATTSNATNVAGILGTLTDEQYQRWKQVLGQRESGNNYRAINRFSFVGKYQFGNPALYDIGFTTQTTNNNTILRNDSSWGGPKSVQTGVRSLQDFLANKGNSQEIAIDLYTRRNYQTLLRNQAISNETPANMLGGYLAVAHLLGAGNAIKFARGDRSKRDGNGVSGQQYFNLGKNAVGE